MVSCTFHLKGLSHLLSGDIDLVSPCDLGRILMQQLQGDVFIKSLDLFVPVFAIQRFPHGLFLFGMEGSISGPASAC